MAAAHIDEGVGISEEVAFFGPDGAQLYASLHTPLDRRPVGGVVICCSIHAELQESYRFEVLLARALAARGIAVQRFHYRGFGHSDGDSADATFEGMREDALGAVQRLIAKTGVTRTALLGVRLGGLVAASAARAMDNAPLVLWAPTSDPVRYFREAFRARLIHRMRTGEARPAAGGALIDELRATGVLDVLGYPIHLALYETAAARTLAEELRGRPRPLLLVQLDGSSELNPDYAALVETLERDGLRVDVQVVPEQPAWWFSGGPGAGLARVGGGTADWLLRRFTEGPA